VSIPTVSSLSATLGQDLTPVGGLGLPQTPVTAVHLSELLDPSPYLTGGELLLTVGIALPSSKIGCRKYASVLKKSGVSALALGLGPVFQEVPQVLVETCAEQELPLLVVPVRTPFMKVTKAYWSALSRSNERHLTDAIATHRELVDAAASADPVAAVLKRLARWLGGWAATLDASGTLDQIHPAGFRQAAEVLESEVRRLEVAGVRSSASFAAAGSVVVLFPLAVKDEIAGYLAVGTDERLDSSQRAVVLGACGLLSLDAARANSQVSADAARRQSVALLLEDGRVEAAQRLATLLHLPPLGRECRVFSVRARDAEATEAIVGKWCDGAVGAALGRTTAWFVAPGNHPELSDLVATLRGADPSTSAVFSDLVRLEDVGPVRLRQSQRLESATPGTFAEPMTTLDIPTLGERLDALAESGSLLVEALAAYLRVHGQWEQAARDLGLHRNTVRHRVERARNIMDVDLGDADVTARLWLLMRDRGLA
jgi:purine catabolism regulator